MTINMKLEERKQLAEIFAAEVMHFVEKNKKTSYLDAALHICEIKNIDIDVAASWIKSHPQLKSLIKINFEDLNFLPKSSRLDV